jgi:hypothetical protein
VEETALLDGDSLRLITNSPDWPSYTLRVRDTSLLVPRVLELGR